MENRTRMDQPFNETEAKLIRLFCNRAEGFLLLQEKGDFKPLDRTVLLQLVDDLEVVVRGKQ